MAQLCVECVDRASRQVIVDENNWGTLYATKQDMDLSRALGTGEQTFDNLTADSACHCSGVPW